MYSGNVGCAEKSHEEASTNGWICCEEKPPHKTKQLLLATGDTSSSNCVRTDFVFVFEFVNFVFVHSVTGNRFLSQIDPGLCIRIYEHNLMNVCISKLW